MMNARGSRLLGTAACAVALILTGCGDDGPTEDTEEPEYDGPIAEFMGWENIDVGDEPEFTEEERQQHYQVQELIVTCMSEAGFEYTPQPFYGDQEDAFKDPHAEVWQLQADDPEAFAREYGYGFTTLEFDEEVETPDPADDPNFAYRESLSPAAQEEYDRALYGGVEGPEEAAGEGTPAPIEPSGCSNDAYEQVFGGGEDVSEDQFKDLFDEWDTLYQRIENDPRMETATQAWLGCMTDAGYPDLEDLYGGQTEVSERQSELYGLEDEEGLLPEPTESVDSDEAEAEAEAEGEGDEESGSGSVEESQPPAEPEPAELEALRQFERDIAVADYTCRQEHDIEGVEREVRYEHEEQFIEDNREQLEAYRDWSNEQGTRG